MFADAEAGKGGEYTSAGVGFEALLGGAKQVHFNMLRVWGGGIEAGFLSPLRRFVCSMPA